MCHSAEGVDREGLPEGAASGLGDGGGRASQHAPPLRQGGLDPTMLGAYFSRRDTLEVVDVRGRIAIICACYPSSAHCAAYRIDVRALNFQHGRAAHQPAQHSDCMQTSAFVASLSLLSAFRSRMVMALEHSNARLALFWMSCQRRGAQRNGAAWTSCSA